MARGDSKKTTAYELQKGNGRYNHTTDVFAWLLVTDTYASVNENATSLDVSDFTPATVGGNYAGKTALAGRDWAQGTNVGVDDNQIFLSFDNITFAADAANPQDAKCLIIINDTSAADDVPTIFDLTDDGTTAVDLRTGFTFNFNASGANRITVNP